MTPARNDPCPCGSGRKYKRCCYRTDVAASPGGRLPDLPPAARAEALAAERWEADVLALPRLYEGSDDQRPVLALVTAGSPPCRSPSDSSTSTSARWFLYSIMSASIAGDECGMGALVRANPNPDVLLAFFTTEASEPRGLCPYTLLPRWTQQKCQRGRTSRATVTEDRRSSIGDRRTGVHPPSDCWPRTTQRTPVHGFRTSRRSHSRPSEKAGTSAFSLSGIPYPAGCWKPNSTSATRRSHPTGSG